MIPNIGAPLLAQTAAAPSWWQLLSYGDAGWLDELLAAAWITLQLALVSLLFGLLGGLGLAILVMSPLRLVRWGTQLFMIVVRGIPEFLVILLIFFGLPLAVGALAQRWGFELNTTIPKFTAAVIALALIFSAYAAEVFRGAWQSIARGEIEAARALGMSDWQVLRYIRLPQMWRFSIPGLGNNWMVLIKDTSLAAVIALDEVLRVAKVASEATRTPMVFFLAAAIIYLALTGVSDVIRIRLERRMGLGARTAA